MELNVRGGFIPRTKSTIFPKKKKKKKVGIKAQFGLNVSSI